MTKIRTIPSSRGLPGGGIAGLDLGTRQLEQSSHHLPRPCGTCNLCRCPVNAASSCCNTYMTGYFAPYHHNCVVIPSSESGGGKLEIGNPKGVCVGAGEPIQIGSSPNQGSTISSQLRGSPVFRVGGRKACMVLAQVTLNYR